MKLSQTDKCKGEQTEHNNDNGLKREIDSKRDSLCSIANTKNSTGDEGRRLAGR